MGRDAGTHLQVLAGARWCDFAVSLASSGPWSVQADKIAAASAASGSSQPSSRLATPEAGCPGSSEHEKEGCETKSEDAVTLSQVTVLHDAVPQCSIVLEQTGYQVAVHDRRADNSGKHLWNSGMLRSSHLQHIALPSFQACALLSVSAVLSFSARYGPIFVFKKLNWTVRQSEKWIVVGGNGTGKTTLVDLITGENVQGYQQGIHLFGRQKGSGESVWEIKKQLGVISSELHME